MMKKIIFVALLCLPFSFGCAVSGGMSVERDGIRAISMSSSSVCGWGRTKGEALSDAMSKLPSGARAGSTRFYKNGDKYVCNLNYTK